MPPDSEPFCDVSDPLFYIKKKGRKKMDNRPIGFFDSGLGGLTAIPYLMETFPKEQIIYFGDTARTPYGSKAVHTIRQFSLEIADFLASQGVKMIVIACNTVTATACSCCAKNIPKFPL